MKIKLVPLVIASLMLSSCVGSAWQLTPADSVTAGDVIKLTALLIRAKPQRVDVRTEVRNLGEKNLLLLLADGSCSRGGVEGRLQYGKLNIGERLINLSPRQTKDKNFTCMLLSPVAKGDIVIKFTHVFDNPSGDGATMGKVLAKNISWIIKDRKS